MEFSFQYGMSLAGHSVEADLEVTSGSLDICYVGWMHRKPLICGLLFPAVGGCLDSVMLV